MSIQEQRLNERSVVDPTGEKVGRVTDVLYDKDGLDPSWLVVNPGVFRAEHFVPVDGAVPEGDDVLVIPYDVDTVKSSPKARNDHMLTNPLREVLAEHYQLAQR